MEVADLRGHKVTHHPPSPSRPRILPNPVSNPIPWGMSLFGCQNGGTLARRARAGRALGIFFDPCPTGGLLPLICWATLYGFAPWPPGHQQIWDGYGPSRTRGDFFDFEVGGHDGAYKGRIHVIVPLIGRKNGTLTARQQCYNDVHGWYRAHIEQLFARLWHAR